MERYASRSQMYDREVSGEDVESETDRMESSDLRDSRAGSLDSEEAALLNGRKTLEEVAAKLNDVDGEKSGKTRIGRRGLISVDRFPFLSNLFNYRSLNNGIVVDEEDANQEDNPIADIFVWRSPTVSAIWFSILQVAFFLCHFCDYSLLTIAATLGLWQLLVDLSLRKLVPKMQKAGLVSDDIDIREVIRKHSLFNPRLIKRVGAASYELSDIMIGMWRITVFEASLGRVLIVSRFVIVVFLRSFSVPTTLWLILMILFTIPVSYSSNRAFADVVADGAHVAANRNFAVVLRLSHGLVGTVESRVHTLQERSKKAPKSAKQAIEFQVIAWRFIMSMAQSFDSFLTKLLG